VHPYEKLLDEAAEALEAERYEDALGKCDAALKLKADEPEALGTRAAALEELGRVEEAIETYAALRRLEPSEPTWTLAAASLLILRSGDEVEATEEGLLLLEGIERQVEEDPRQHFDWLFLVGVALNQLGELEDSLEALESAIELFPDDPEARVERAVVLFELCRFEPAKAALEALARELPEDPMPPHYLGLLAERRGDEAAARKLFATAAKLDPEGFPPAVVLSEKEFDSALEAAIAALPGHARAELGNVTISVEPFPDDASLRSGEVTPTILGVFVGTPLDERSPLSAEDHQTARIVLYQRNLERFARTREELIEQIRITVLHEVGHLLGLDEEELRERGLD
jgi:predicted Zn-dependent protease with MMP-like domain/Flp pilus assembly protein TadD